MRRILFLAAVLGSVSVPMAARAEAGPTVSKQSICVPVIVETPEGPVEGILCFPQGGRV